MGVRWPVIYTTFCCCLGSLGFGLHVGYSSPAIPQLTKPGELLHGHLQEAYLFGSLGALGSGLGCFLAGILTEALGRRWTAIINCIPYMVGWALITNSQTINALLIGRIFTGCAAAVAGVLSPIYVAETSSRQWRGVLVTVTSFCITFGVFSGYMMGLFLTWGQQANVGIMLSVLTLICAPFAPETPRYLVKSGEVLKGRRILACLHGEGIHIDEELKEIEASLKEPSLGYKDVILSRQMRAPFQVAVGLMLFSSLTGIAVIMSFMSTIFQNAGYSDEDSLKAPAIIVAMQLLSMIASGAILDRVGRIPLLLLTSFGMALSYFLMGLFFYIDNGQNYNWVLFLCLVGYKFSFGFGWCVICPLMATEIMPTRARGPATAFSHIIASLSSFVLAAYFHTMTQTMGLHGVLWLYAVFCIMGALFVVRYVPETKGRTLEEIESFFIVM